jgi:hypothetical protein
VCILFTPSIHNCACRSRNKQGGEENTEKINKIIKKKIRCRKGIIRAKETWE